MFVVVSVETHIHLLYNPSENLANGCHVDITSSLQLFRPINMNSPKGHKLEEFISEPFYKHKNPYLQVQNLNITLEKNKHELETIN